MSLILEPAFPMTSPADVLGMMIFISDPRFTLAKSKLSLSIESASLHLS